MERVWVQNVNNNKNRNQDETSSENDSTNNNLNVNDLLLLKKIIEEELYRSTYKPMSAPYSGSYPSQPYSPTYP